MARWGPLLVLLLALGLGLILHRESGLDLGLDQLKALFASDLDRDSDRDRASDQDPVSVPEKSVEQRVSEAWDSLIQPPQKQWRRAAVGVNSCVDLVVSGVALLEALGLEPSESGSGRGSDLGLDHEVLDSLEDLKETFQFFMSRGAAAERFFSNGELFQKICSTALSLPSAKLYVGGNAALIGQKLASNDNIEVLLAGPVGPKLHELLDEKIVVPPEALQENDEIHLILEYQTGQRWGPLAAPQANRFIFSHDEANARLRLVESLVQSLDQFDPDLVVLSGLHMMEGLQPAARDLRLDQVVELLSQISVPVHLELASMTDPHLMQRLVHKVFPLISSLGLNEQELLFLSRSVGGPHSDLSWTEVGVASPAAVAVASDVLGWILRRFGTGSAPLSRVHFHALPFHLVAVATGRWGNQAASAAAGARTASAQACGRTHVHAPEAELRAPLRFNINQSHALTLDPDQPITVWQQHHVTLHLAPVLVCKRPIRTVGLGDAISANGLLFSEILP